MSEKKYVDVDVLVKNIASISDLRTISTKTIGEAIHNTPAADVEEVQHGEWINKIVADNGVAEMKSVCSLCNKPNKQYQPPYCPHCGARMDTEQEKNT